MNAWEMMPQPWETVLELGLGLGIAYVTLIGLLVLARGFWEVGKVLVSGIGMMGGCLMQKVWRTRHDGEEEGDL